MDHVVYLDAQSKKLDSLLSGQKTMIILGATGRKLPLGRLGRIDPGRDEHPHAHGSPSAPDQLVPQLCRFALVASGGVMALIFHGEI